MSQTLPTDAQERKAIPIYSGVIRYFPDALMEVARLSQIGNEQHNPGQPLFWDRTKSGDELDALTRHLMDAGTMDTDGVRHSAKVAWRALANLQKEIEISRGIDPTVNSGPSRGTVNGKPKPLDPRLKTHRRVHQPRVEEINRMLEAITQEEAAKYELDRPYPYLRHRPDFGAKVDARIVPESALRPPVDNAAGEGNIAGSQPWQISLEAEGNTSDSYSDLEERMNDYPGYPEDEGSSPI